MTIEFNGRYYQTGYLPQRNTSELRYAFRSIAPQAVNWNVPAAVAHRPSKRFQNGEPSCVGQSLAAAFEILHPEMPRASSAYIWQSAKNLRGWKGYTGVYINDGCDVSLSGVPSEQDMPSNFSIQDYIIPTNPKLYDAFKSHQVTTAIHADQIYDAIASGMAVVSGIGMDSLSFNNMQFQGGLVSAYNSDRSKWDFWHAMVATDALTLLDGRKIIVYQNSWLQFWSGDNRVHPLVDGFNVAFDVDILNVVGFEHRVISPEARIPDPNPNPVNNFLTTYKKYEKEVVDQLKQEKASTISKGAKTRIQHYVDGISILGKYIERK